MSRKTSRYINGIKYDIVEVKDKVAIRCKGSIYVAPDDYNRIKNDETDVMIKLEDQCPKHVIEGLKL